MFSMSQKSPLLHPVLSLVHHVSVETVLLNLNPVNKWPYAVITLDVFLLKLVGPCLRVSLMVMCNSQFHALKGSRQ
jgi:hypothetical protein